MRATIACLALACLVTSIAGTPARAAQDPGTFYLRGFVGYTGQALEDVNNDIELTGLAISVVSTGTDWEKIGGAVPFGAEFGYHISPIVSLGAGVGYQRTRQNHSAAIDFFDPTSNTATVGTVNEDPTVSLLDFFGAVTLWIPSAPGLHFTGQLGVARGKYELAQHVNVASSDTTFEVSAFTASAEKTAVMAGIFAGYEWPLSQTVGMSGRFGYRFCNFSTPKADFTYSGETEAGPFRLVDSGPLTDIDGNPMDLDLSGLQFDLGVTVRLGAPR